MSLFNVEAEVKKSLFMNSQYGKSVFVELVVNISVGFTYKII